ERIVLLLHEAVYATVQRVANVAGVPAVAIIPASSFPDGVDPVVEPRSVGRGIPCAVLVRESPAVLNGNLKKVLRQGRLPLEAICVRITRLDAPSRISGTRRRRHPMIASDAR